MWPSFHHCPWNWPFRNRESLTLWPCFKLWGEQVSQSIFWVCISLTVKLLRLLAVIIISAGCTLRPTKVMDTCCFAVNSTTEYVGNNTFACPFNKTGAIETAWEKCITVQRTNTDMICNIPNTTENMLKFGYISDHNVATSPERSKLLTLMVALLLVGMLTHAWRFSPPWPA